MTDQLTASGAQPGERAALGGTASRAKGVLLMDHRWSIAEEAGSPFVLHKCPPGSLEGARGPQQKEAGQVPWRLPTMHSQECGSKSKGQGRVGPS